MKCELVKKSGSWEVSQVDGAGGDLVVAFSSIGHDPERVPAPEFMALASGRGARRALFFADGSRRWGQDPEFSQLLPEMVARVAAQRSIERMLLIGASMGACLALKAAHLVKAQSVLAFGPQWAVGPDAKDARWQNWTQHLSPGAGARGSFPLPAEIWAVICHGDRDDLGQARQFPKQAGLDHLIFAGADHSGLVGMLKARGGLGGMIDAALEGDRRRFLRIASQANAKLRARLPEL